MRSNEAYAFAALTVLFVLMAASFVALPWPSELVEVPFAGSDSVVESLFFGYPFTVVLIALILAVAMIGGTFLAKREGGVRP